MRFTPLASSSNGNAYILEDGKSRLLIECGLKSYSKLQKLMGFDTCGLCGCLISHEHKDHARLYEQLLKNGVRVYASGGTAEALGCELLDILEYMTPVTVGTFEVLPFPTFHDAAEPMGFLIRSMVDGDKLAFATDTVNLGYRFPCVGILAVECNHDEDILARAERMPKERRQRVCNTHMSVARLCAWLEGLDLSRTREIYLMHLSDACSNEWLFRRRVEEVVPRSVQVIVCPRESCKR